MAFKIRPKRFGTKIATLIAAFALFAQPLAGIVATRTANAEPDPPTSVVFNGVTLTKDRTLPSGSFNVADGVLTMGVDNTKASTDSFYRTEGLKGAIPVSWSVEAELYIDPEWSGKSVMAGLWAATSSDTSSYQGWPELEYRSNVGGFTGWRVFDTMNMNGGYVYLESVPAPTPNSWYKLKISYNPVTNNYDYYVNGIVLTSLPAIDSEDNSIYDKFTHVIFNTLNSATGSNADDYSVKWRNLSFIEGEAPIPVPQNLRIDHNGAPLAAGSTISYTDGIKLVWDTLDVPARYRVTATHPDGTKANFQPSTSNTWNPASISWNPSDAVRRGFFGAESGDKGEGTYSYTVAVQVNGKWSSESAPITLTYDNTAPTVTIDQPATDGAKVKNSTNVVVTGTDNLELKSVTAHLYDNAGNQVPSVWQHPNVDGTSKTLTLPLTGLADGDYLLKTAATDESGKSVYASRHFTIDSTAPVIQINGAEVVGNPYFKIGQAIDVHVSDNNLVETEVTRLDATSDNHWDYDGAYFGLWWLRDGDYEMTSTDAAGNATTVTFRVDHTRPVVSSTSHASGVQSGSTLYNPTSFTHSANDDSSNNANGDAQSGLARVVGNIYKYDPTNLEAGGDGYYLFESNSTANPTLTVDLSGLTNGTYYVRYNASDAAGNVSNTEQFYFVVDKTRSDITLTTPVHGQITNGNFTISGTAYDANGVEKVLITIGKRDTNNAFSGYVINDVEATWDGTSFTYDVTNLPEIDGTYYVRAIAYDPAGNAHSEGADNVVVDTTKPDVQITNPEDGGLYNTDVEVRGTVTDPNLRHYWLNIKRNGTVIHSQTVMSGSFTEDQALYTLTTDGDYVVTLAARDSAGGGASTGNRSADVVVSFTIDKSKPTAPTLDSPADGAIVNGASVSQSWNASSSDDVDHYVYASYHDEDATNLRWRGEFTTTSKTATKVADSTYWWRVKAVDKAGNESDWSDELRKLTIDNEPPSVAIPPSYTTTANVITPTVTVNDENNPLTYAWTQTGGPTTGVTISDPTVAVPDFTVTEDGDYIFTLTVTDPAGNNASSTFSFTYTSPPVLAAVTTSGTGTPAAPVVTAVSQTPATGTGFTNVAVTGDNATDVLGTETPNTSAVDENGVTSGAFGETVTPNVDNDNTLKLLGLAWYWWLVILAVGGLGWWLFASMRRANED